MMRNIVVLIILTLMLSLTFQNPVRAESNYPNIYITVDWVKYANPSTGMDQAYGVCGVGDVIYIIGSAQKSLIDYSFRIEMRNKSTGELIKIWELNPSDDMDELFNCIIIGDKLYAVGYEYSGAGGWFDYQWSIVELDLQLNLVKNVTINPTDGDDKAISLVSDGSYLYVVGFKSISSLYGEDTAWFIAKLDLTTLDTVKTVEFNPSEDEDRVSDIGINPITQELWVVGGNRSYAQLLILDKDLSIVKSKVFTEYWGEGYSIVFDGEGYGYLVAEFATYKLSPSGENISLEAIGGYKALVAFNKLFIGDTVYLTGARQALHILDLRPSVIKTVVLDNTTETESYFAIGRMYYSDGRIYIAGYESNGEDYTWVIYCVSIYTAISKPTETITSTITITPAITKSTTITTTKYSTVTTTSTTTLTTTSTTTTYNYTTIYKTETTTQSITETKMKTTTKVSTTTATQVDMGITAIAAIIALIIGAVIGLFIRR